MENRHQKNYEKKAVYRRMVLSSKSKRLTYFKIRNVKAIGKTNIDRKSAPDNLINTDLMTTHD